MALTSFRCDLPVHRGRGPVKLGFEKDPDTDIEIGVILDDRLPDVADIISEDWSSENDFYTLSDPQTGQTREYDGAVFTRVATVLCSGGTEDQSGEITLRVTYDAYGRTNLTEDITMVLKCRQQ